MVWRLIFTSISLVYKKVGDLANILTFLLQLLTGLVIPIRSLPKFMQYICYICPTTWAIDSVRSSLPEISPILPFGFGAVILIVSVLIVHFLGQFLLRSAERKMQRDGLLELY
ncbi:MAG: ABC transporter permease [Clostridiaceae bacterium]|nr:ABC transporter permease [Clostridiaceae bacterium]